MLDGDHVVAGEHLDLGCRVAHRNQMTDGLDRGEIIETVAVHHHVGDRHTEVGTDLLDARGSGAPGFGDRHEGGAGHDRRRRRADAAAEAAEAAALMSCSVSVNAYNVPVVSYSDFSNVSSVSIRRNGTFIDLSSAGMGTYEDTTAVPGVAY